MGFRDSSAARSSVLDQQAGPSAESQAATAPPVQARLGRKSLALLRFALGWTFLWPFLDKTFGLGFPTPSEGAWIEGGSPTSGFLASRDGDFSGLFEPLAGLVWVDWVFMGALAALAFALFLGIGLRLAAIGGSALMLSLWAAQFQPEMNPFMDEHIVYAAALILLAATSSGDTLGLGKAWGRSALVQKLAILR